MGLREHRNLRQIEECIGQLGTYTVGVEFRNAFWLKDDDRAETLSFLREHNLQLVTVDEPQGFHSSMPLLWEATSSELAVVRLHGKKELATSALRFKYVYSGDEPKAVHRADASAFRQSAKVHVMFNNRYEDKAQRNASRFVELLGHSPA